MMKQAHAPEKSSCCKSQQPKSCRFGPREFDFRAEDSDLSDNKLLHSLPKFNLMDLPLHPPAQPKLAAGEGWQGTGDRVIDSAAPVVQRYVKVGLYEGSLGMDHIGVGVNSEKTKGFSPKEGLGREAEKGSWVEGEVKEDHDMIDSLTIRTDPGQEARLQAALNRSESSSQKFHLYQHNCAQHGAQLLNSAGLGVKSSPMPRAFFEGLRRQFKTGQEKAKGQPLQGKFKFDAPAAKPEEAAPRPNRTGMPDRLKAGIESLSGIDMSDVRVYANSDKPAGLGALAYTQGYQIYLGPGQERHLPHEAWHAVQQKQGRVRPTRQMIGVEVNDEAGLEREADVTGMHAAQLKPVGKSNLAPFSSVKQQHFTQIVQRMQIMDTYVNKETPDKDIWHLLKFALGKCKLEKLQKEAESWEGRDEIKREIQKALLEAEDESSQDESSQDESSEDELGSACAKASDEEPIQSPDSVQWEKFPRNFGEFKLMGVHEAQSDLDARSLVKNGPETSKIGTGQTAAHGRGFYVTRVTGSLEAALQGIRWGKIILAVYLHKDWISYIISHSAAEIIIEEGAFPHVKIFRDPPQ